MRVGSLPSPREYDGRLPPDAGYYPDLVLPRFGEPRKKIGSQGKIIAWKNITNRVINLLVKLARILVNLLVFWDWVACKLITIFLIILHVVIRTCTCFFFEIPSFEELQDPDSSPRREEVGRRTLGDYGGFLPSFFLSG